MQEYLDPLTDWPRRPPPGYSGQLDEDFQEARAALYAGVTLEECSWYHTTELADGSVVQGQWDLRGREDEYLGGVDLAGRSVLEIGPATGYLTLAMEQRGATVTSFEAGYDAAIAMVPSAFEAELPKREADIMEHTRRSVNAWWYLHRTRASRARLVHGDIYNLPADLGTHDVVVMASILLHCRDFAKALQQAAAHAGDTVVVTEPLHRELDTDRRLVGFMGDADVINPAPVVGWWIFSPGAIAAMLWRLGFPHVRQVRHTQRYSPGDGQVVEVPFFTVVASRVPPADLSVPAWLGESSDRYWAARARGEGLEEENRQLREELERLRATRTFRWTAPARDLYGRLRRR